MEIRHNLPNINDKLIIYPKLNEKNIELNSLLILGDKSQ